MQCITQGVATGTLYKELKKKEALIQKQLNIIERILSMDVKGGLKVSKRGSKFAYYRRTSEPESGKKLCEYINTSDIDIAKQIVLRDYFESVRKLLLREQKAIKTFNLSDLDREIDECYTKMDDGRKVLITPLLGTAQSKITAWQNEKYEQNLSHPESLIHDTDRGDFVRSKSEQLIANYLYSLKEFIDYKYERPLELTVNGKKEIINPDFTIINLLTGEKHIIEHVSRLDISDYHDAFVWKNKAYVENGLVQDGTIIYSFESEGYPLNLKQIKRLVNDYII